MSTTPPLSLAPTGPVDNITFSSVTDTSMLVSWGEVSCNQRNGPITGYNLTYNSYTVINITNRQYMLRGLLPYTNYTVTVIPYNGNEVGPPLNASQLTRESGKLLVNDTLIVSILFVSQFLVL